MGKKTKKNKMNNILHCQIDFGYVFESEFVINPLKKKTYLTKPNRKIQEYKY